MSILAGLIAVVSNLTVCFILLRTENWLATKGKIPARGEILYLEDYNFFKWGDKWFLSTMDFAIAFVLVERWPLPAWIVALSLLIGVVCPALWHWIYLRKSHRPNSAHPFTGVVSLVGRVHFIYCGAQHILGCIGITMVVLMITGESWSTVAFVGLAAILGYCATLFSDVVAGRH